jgi:hypothetical protein
VSKSLECNLVAGSSKDMMSFPEIGLQVSREKLKDFVVCRSITDMLASSDG